MCYNKLMNKRAVIGAICAISTLFALQGSALTFAEGENTASSTFSIDVSNAVLQLSVPSDASITLNPTSSAGDFGSTNLNIKVSTNNATGYRLSMSVPTTDLTHSTNTGSNAPVISTLTSSAPESTFPTNAWGYKVVGDNYNPILLNNTPSSWEADGPTNETTHIMTLAAKVDGAKAAGAYINTLTFQVVANPNSPKDTIIFNGNGADGGTMGNQQVFQGEPTKLNVNTYTKSGYAFNGWNTRADGLGTGYGDKDYYTAPATNTATAVTLYAQWLEDSKRVCTANCDSGNPTYEAGITIQRAYELAYTEHHLGMYEETEKGNGIYERVNSWPPDNEPYKNYDVRFAMQDIDLTYNSVKVCDLVTVIGDQYQALDVRDNKLYYISKLADGKCWMTQNLDFNLSVNTKLSPLTTDVLEEITPIYSTLDATNGFKPEDTSVYSDTKPNSIDVGNWYFKGGDTSRWERCQSCTGSSQRFNYLAGRGQGLFNKDQPSEDVGEHGHVGNFYNWTALVALNDSSAYLNNDTYSNHDNAPKTSICPQGWRLPAAYGNNSVDYSSSNDTIEMHDIFNLYSLRNRPDLNSDTYVDTGTVEADPIYAVPGGHEYLKNVEYVGIVGVYLHDSTDQYSQAYSVSYGGPYYFPRSAGNRSYSFNARCIAR